MKVHNLINHPIRCECGKTHVCNLKTVKIGANVLEFLPELMENYQKILLVADNHTDPLCGAQVCSFLQSKVAGKCVLFAPEHLVPNEQSIAKVESCLTEQVDFILGIGSGVINDLCKYVSFFHGLPYGIIATAPSMDGYASSGAAMILNGMKVTVTTHVPTLILADEALLRSAPMEMIQSGYADIIGKYSALNDWKLSHLITGEHFCPFLYRVVMETTDRVRMQARRIAARDGQAIVELMEALVLVGVCLSLHTTTRPGSGSEHHLSHYFEITGLIHKKPYFLHGTDVGYSTVVTARLRQEICKIETPVFFQSTRQERMDCYRRIYGAYADQVMAIQDEAGSYQQDDSEKYREKWAQIVEILQDCPSAEEVWQMLEDVGMRRERFVELYGPQKIRSGVWFGKDLKNRYSVLWLYYALFFTQEEYERIHEQTSN